MRLRELGMGLSLLAVPAALHAHRIEPINIEYGSTVSRPFLDIGLQHFRISGRRRSSITTPQIGMEIPLRPSFQVEFRVPLEITRGNIPGGQGLGDIEMGAKYWFYGRREESAQPNLGLNFEVGLPSGKKEIGFGRETEYTVGIFLNNTVGRITNFANFSYGVGVPLEKDEHESNEKSFDFRYAVVMKAARNLFPTLEFISTRNITEGELDVRIVPEIQYLAGRHSIVKFGVPVGLNKHSPDLGVQFQLTFTW